METVLGLKLDVEEDKEKGFPGVVCRWPLSWSWFSIHDDDWGGCGGDDDGKSLWNSNESADDGDNEDDDDWWQWHFSHLFCPQEMLQPCRDLLPLPSNCHRHQLNQHLYITIFTFYCHRVFKNIFSYVNLLPSFYEYIFLQKSVTEGQATLKIQVNLDDMVIIEISMTMLMIWMKILRISMTILMMFWIWYENIDDSFESYHQWKERQLQVEEKKKRDEEEQLVTAVTSPTLSSS